ncbi:hypothetical protein HBH64_060280 [Parastagonospora nodorum]|nr:hypothetical protein HBI95_012580 [Parastagonospora nodorum]KAH4236958.1 hypothetical protein HBI06_048430 [Parastagonospora nodorum]KAH4248386.1 hypothetical protein HBI05_018770 [Parastagonospora nodorum]KAH4311346.1 hypothetical protein HBI01_011520 [Parastagonospora nodorum]KAH4317154.1 hypothetical protein HBI02_027840 [Parastagonospora nodorum]
MAKVGGCRAVVDTRLLYELAVLATCDLRPAACGLYSSAQLTAISSILERVFSRWCYYVD